MEKNEGLGIFSSKFVEMYQESKISTMCLANQFFLIGDEKGNLKIFKFTLKEDTYQFTEIEKKLVAKNKQIETIRWESSNSIIYVLCNKTLFVYQVPEFEIIQFDIKDEVVAITPNKHRENLNQILLITKKKKIKVFAFNREIRKLVQLEDKDLSVQETPDLMEWYGKWFCYSAKGKVYFINIGDGKCPKPQDVQASSLLYMNDSFFVNMNGFGMFLEPGGPKSCNPISLEEHNFKLMSLYKNYLVSLFDNKILINDINTTELVQVIPVEQSGGFSGKLLVANDSNIFFITGNKEGSEYHIWEIRELPLDKQIDKLLLKNRIDEACLALNNGINSLTPEKPNSIEEFFLKCGWSCFKRHNEASYAEAYNYFHISNLNPFELIYMFCSLLKVKPIHEEFIKLTPEQQRKVQIETILEKDKDKINLAVKFLIDVLKDKREYLMRTNNTSTETSMQIKTINFLKTNLSEVKLIKKEQGIPLLNVLQMINSTLVKALVKMEYVKEYGKIIIEDPCNTDYTSDGFLNDLNNDYSKIALAHIYEKKKDYENSLKVLKSYVGVGIDPKIRKCAKEAIIRIFKGFKAFKEIQSYKQCYEENITWVISEYKKESFEIQLETQVVDNDYFLNKLIPEVEKKKEVEPGTYQEAFLKHINDNPNYANEKYQTLLLEYMIENLSKDTPLNSPEAEIKDKKNYIILKESIEKWTLYNKIHILGLIKDTWLIEPQIFLYIKLEKYDRALGLLIELWKKNLNSDDLIKFCSQNYEKKETLFNDLFSLLIDEYNKVKDNEKQASEIKKFVLSLLKKFQTNELFDPEHRSQFKLIKFRILDPAKVLEKIPREWKIFDKKENSEEQELYKYIYYILSQYEHFSNTYKLLKELAQLDLLYNQKELYDCKNQSIIIENDSICNYCNKKIGNSIFVVYPNMKIFHSKCATNPSIDPRTKVDFSKAKI